VHSAKQGIGLGSAFIGAVSVPYPTDLTLKDPDPEDPKQRSCKKRRILSLFIKRAVSPFLHW